MNVEAPTPLKPPSPEVLAKPGAKLPSSNFVADYSGSAASKLPFKATMEQGRLRLVTQLPQGYSGMAAERYPTGEMCASRPCTRRPAMAVSLPT